MKRCEKEYFPARIAGNGQQPKGKNTKSCSQGDMVNLMHSKRFNPGDHQAYHEAQTELHPSLNVSCSSLYIHCIHRGLSFDHL